MSSCEKFTFIENCFHCDFEASTGVHLQYHLKTEHYKSKCDECGKRFLNERSLAAHKSRIHRKGNEFKCKICDETILGDPSTLRNHELLCNGRSITNNFKGCESMDTVKNKTLCNTLDTQTSFKKQNKPYIAYCRIKDCDAVFRSQSLVKGAVSRRRQHEAKHGADDLYECHYCKATYQEYTDYLDHLKRCSIKFGAPNRPCDVNPTAGLYHIFI